MSCLDESKAVVVPFVLRVALCVIKGSENFGSPLLPTEIELVVSNAEFRARELSLGFAAFIFFGANDSSSEGKSKMSMAFVFLGTSLEGFITVDDLVSTGISTTFVSFLLIRDGVRPPCLGGGGLELSLGLVGLDCFAITDLFPSIMMSQISLSLFLLETDRAFFCVIGRSSSLVKSNTSAASSFFANAGARAFARREGSVDLALRAILPFSIGTSKMSASWMLSLGAPDMALVINSRFRFLSFPAVT